MSNFNPITDLRPVDQDRPSEVSSEELGAIKVRLMETAWSTKQIVKVLERKNRLLERDIEKITNLKRRLRRSIGIIPGMPGRSSAILGGTVAFGFAAFPLAKGKGMIQDAYPAIPPRSTRPPTPQEDSIRVEDDIKVDVREDVKQDIRVPEGETIRAPEGQTDQGIITDTSRIPTNEEISNTDVKAGVVAGTDAITKALTQPEKPTNEEISGTIEGVLASQVQQTATIKPYNPNFIEQIGNVFNSWFADRNRRKKWLKSPEYKLLQLELAKMNVSDVDINWGAVFDWTVAIGAVAFPGDAVFGDLAAVANLLMKGRITWGLLVRVFGKKGVEKLYNYFMQKGIQVPQWNLSSSIKPNSSSFNIASASDSVNSDGLHSHTRKKDVFVFITDQSIA